MTLGKLIAWLEKQDQYAVVLDGFGMAHSNPHAYYNEVEFTPDPRTTISDMLFWAKDALGGRFTGYSGASFLATSSTLCHIGDGGLDGEEITEKHFDEWV